jgi:hypothetical protein
MLARRAKVQKPCPALSFQNAEKGFPKTNIKDTKIEITKIETLDY